MWKSLGLLLLSVSSARAAECANAVADGDSDQCQLLQSSAGVVAHHDHVKVSAGSSKEKANVTKANGSDPWDILKGITDIIGSGANMTANLDKAKEEIPKLLKEIHEIAVKLTADVHSAVKSEDVEKMVEAAYTALHDDTKQVADLLIQVPQAFLDGVGKMMPENIRGDLQHSLDHVAAKLMSVAEAFKAAGDQLRQQATNHTALCLAVGEGLVRIKADSDKLVASAKALLPEDFDEKVHEALTHLPDSVKDELDKLIAKAKSLADELAQMTEPAQEVIRSVHDAFAEYCPDLKGAAGHVQMSLLAASVVFLSLSM